MTSIKKHGFRQTREEILKAMDTTMREHLDAAQGEEEPGLGRGFHFGVVSATAIWASAVSKMDEAAAKGAEKKGETT